jgi:hypothetical protein
MCVVNHIRPKKECIEMIMVTTGCSVGTAEKCYERMVA